ncbi:hypothetical protein GG344DRAFT_83738 [Lentinula edodes]|nr:hypothetical protein GG344DRAFT_83738 [Lentinula edodes]
MFYVILPVHKPLPGHYLGTRRDLGSLKAGWSNTNNNINDDPAVKQTTKETTDIIEVRRSFKGFGFLGMSNTQRFSTTSKSSTTTLPSFFSSSAASTLPSSSTLATTSTTSRSSLNDKFPPSSDTWDSDDNDGWKA